MPARHEAHRRDHEVDDNRMMKGFDDKTFTNAGLSVGMGAFTFGASYATRDDGGYVSSCQCLPARTDRAATRGRHCDTAAVAHRVRCGGAMPAVDDGGMIPCDHPNGWSSTVRDTTISVSGSDSPFVGRQRQHRRHRQCAVHRVRRGRVGQQDTWAVGITYSDGPMTVSIDHMTREREDGVERTATMRLGRLQAGAGRGLEDLDHRRRGRHLRGGDHGFRRHRLRDRPRPRLLDRPLKGTDGRAASGRPAFFAPAHGTASARAAPYRMRTSLPGRYPARSLAG